METGTAFMCLIHTPRIILNEPFATWQPRAYPSVSCTGRPHKPISETGGLLYLGFSLADEVEAGPRKWRKEVSLIFDICHVPRILIGNGPSKLEEKEVC